MKSSLMLKMAWRNLTAYKQFNIPFIIASSFMGMLFFIGASLLDNDFVKTRHESLVMVMGFAVIIVGIFSIVFITYANKLISKQRGKELALYGILGLEKRHINGIMLTEQNICFVVITLISLVGGRVFGKLTFLLFNKITGSGGVPLMKYPVTASPIIMTLGVLFAAYLYVAIRGVGKIYKSSPIELMSGSKKPEGEPKNRWILMVLGLLFLGGGYFVALTTEGTIAALTIFFGAVLAVIVGTYLLFISLGTFVLKALRRRKRYYYKPENFLTISGMLYRINSNGIGLGSIALLSTSIILTIAMTSTAYLQVDKIVESSFLDDQQITRGISGDEEFYQNNSPLEEKIEKTIYDTAKGDESIENLRFYRSSMSPVDLDKGEMKPIYSPGSPKAKAYNEMNVRYLVIIPLEDYNKVMGTDYKLDGNEVIIERGHSDIGGRDTFKLAGTERKVTHKFDGNIGGDLAVESATIIVPNFDDFRKVLEYYANSDVELNGKKISQMNYNLNAIWHVRNRQADYEKRMENACQDDYILYGSRENARKLIMDFNGGFFFIGILIGSIFLIGAILIMYYKQISEGLEDRKNYEIMAKVGLPDKIVRKTTRRQILWIFFLPLAVAVMHCIVASKIVFQIMRLFLVKEVWFFAENLVIVTGGFVVLYLLVYLVTSKIYYRIVS